ATRARTPNEGWFQAMGPVTGPVVGVPPIQPLERTALLANTRDVRRLGGLNQQELRDVNAIVYHSWQASRHRVAGLDAETGGLQFTGPARWAFFQSEPYHRIVFENYRDALDAEGEWFLSRSGTLYYKPRAGE